MSLVNSNLIFVVSQPRSGSTLLQSILSNNPYVSTCNEPWILLPFLGNFEKDLNKAKYNSDWMSWSVDQFIKNHIGEDYFHSQLRDFLCSMYAPLQQGDCRYILDKTPRYYEILFAIRKIFPDAKFLVLKRNPLAVAYSIVKTWNINSVSKLTDYRFDLLAAPQRIQKFLMESKGSNDVFEIRYEDLVRKPSDTVAAVYSWLGLPFDPGVLNYGQNDKIHGALGDQVGLNRHSRPVSESIDSWRKVSPNSFLGRFFCGYSGYLGGDFLSIYGDYDHVTCDSSKEFNYFLHSCGRLESKGFDTWAEVRSILKSLFYQVRFGGVRKEFDLTTP